MVLKTNEVVEKAKIYNLILKIAIIHLKNWVLFITPKNFYSNIRVY